MRRGLDDALVLVNLGRGNSQLLQNVVPYMPLGTRFLFELLTFVLPVITGQQKERRFLGGQEGGGGRGPLKRHPLG